MGNNCSAGRKRVAAAALILGAGIGAMGCGIGTLPPAFTPSARPTGVTPSPTITSFVGHREDESMLCRGVFRITVTMVSHLSNAMLLSLEVENTAGEPAAWSPAVDVAGAYVLDGDRRLEVRDASGVFSRDSVLESGVQEAGWLVFPLAREDAFRFFYPACEPEFVTLRPP
jgi:hypothetical protein